MGISSLIGTRLRERRMALGLRQGDLAQEAEISASYLNLIEHNRRKVTPEILARLAQVLGSELSALSEGAGQPLAEDLRAAAAGFPNAAAEVDRLEEFAGRFPGWAAVTAGLQARAGQLERAVEALNDRMTHDPHLSAALHELLSALTSVRATAEILAETGDLAADLRHRFHRNLHLDAERLAGGAEALVAYLEGTDGGGAAGEQGLSAPLEEVEAWLAGQGWHLQALEDGDLAALAPGMEALASTAARALAEAHLERSAAEARLLPLDPFRAALKELGPDPALLAARFGSDPLTVMRRMALLPGAAAGFVSCDASGTLTFRKPIAGFALPRFGAACPLWPLYAALGRPMQPVQAQVETPGPSGARFKVLAYCQPALAGGFGGPELREAAMLILPVTGTEAGPALGVGSTCRICPRADCPARREPSITREGI
ncbi:short-chain fatty acyl-CoA regulator family protein [Xinfangfangia sp. CPCC 101601]|uniref:Short-chain fatty acyl-CoA regulator family protein n=1 Tax=Pseudogemmobacter lacusdianii TaxID=3069608 RepID=A0ABU0VYE0_9RHOB|nr:XRE family transcriptional regulator [Xinfangfangia sp. CPCC 101601]MDQ2066771.1 short-chain fatty acyl-CoA regulator family protein [Xinfangfangia sp. CPCC 101601]